MTQLPMLTPLYQIRPNTEATFSYQFHKGFDFYALNPKSFVLFFTVHNDDKANNCLSFKVGQ